MVAPPQLPCLSQKSLRFLRRGESVSRKGVSAASHASKPDALGVAGDRADEAPVEPHDPERRAIDDALLRQRDRAPADKVGVLLNGPPGGRTPQTWRDAQQGTPS